MTLNFFSSSPTNKLERFAPSKTATYSGRTLLIKKKSFYSIDTICPEARQQSSFCGAVTLGKTTLFIMTLGIIIETRHSA